MNKLIKIIIDFNTSLEKLDKNISIQSEQHSQQLDLPGVYDVLYWTASKYAFCSYVQYKIHQDEHILFYILATKQIQIIVKDVQS